MSKCSLYVFTIIPPRLTDPRNFITVLLKEQTTLLFRSAACSVTPHGLHTADRVVVVVFCFLCVCIFCMALVEQLGDDSW